MKKGKGEGRKEIDLGILGLGGIFKNLGSFLDLLVDLAEKGETEIHREQEIGPIGEKGTKAVYGFSVKIGGKGKPTVETFGNVRETPEKGPVVEEVREPLVDVFDEGQYLLVIAELPGVKESDIKYEVKDDILILSGETGDRKYYKEILLPTVPAESQVESSYRNGILELKLWKPTAKRKSASARRPTRRAEK
jgi:HSP20 family protein